MLPANSRNIFESQYLCALPVLTEKDRTVASLAKRYHKETEAYDLVVCTGPIRFGEIMPASYRESSLINRHAIEVLNGILLEATSLGISRQEITKAIHRQRP